PRSEPRYPAWERRKRRFLWQLQHFFFTQVLQLRRADPPNQSLASWSYTGDNDSGPAQGRLRRRLRHSRARERRAPATGGSLAPKTTAVSSCPGPCLHGAARALGPAPGSGTGEEGRRLSHGRGRRQANPPVPARDVAVAVTDGSPANTGLSRDGDRSQPHLQALGAKPLAPPGNPGATSGSAAAASSGLALHPPLRGRVERPGSAVLRRAPDGHRLP